VFVFVEGGKTRKPREKPLEQRREPKTNSTHIWHQAGIEPGSSRSWLNLEFGVLVFVEGGKLENPEKTRNIIGTRMRTINKLNPHTLYDTRSELNIRPGPHWWEASALTTAPSLFP